MEKNDTELLNISKEEKGGDRGGREGRRGGRGEAGGGTSGVEQNGIPSSPVLEAVMHA